MRHTILLSLGLLVGLAWPLHADEIFLVNGDRLTGKIARLVDGKLIFQSDLVGEVTVNAENIRSFSTEAPIVIHLQDGSVVKHQVSEAEAGHITIEPGPILGTQRLQLADVVAINPPPKPPVKWAGNVAAGFTVTMGNSETKSANLSVGLGRRTETDRITFDAAYLFSQEDGDTSNDEWFAALQYDYFLTRKLFPYASIRVAQDQVADLDLRLLAGLGVGYQWFETPDFNFSTQGGLAWRFEAFEGEENNEQLSLQLKYHLDKRFNDRVTVFHDTEFYPSLEDFSDYYLISQAGMRMSLTQAMFTETKVVLEHDATPAEDAEKTDFTYILGVGWNF